MLHMHLMNQWLSQQVLRKVDTPCPTSPGTPAGWLLTLQVLVVEGCAAQTQLVLTLGFAICYCSL